MAGIDHGFYEAYNRPRRHIQVASWVILGATTFCMLMTTAAQFFPGAFWVFLAVGVVQFAVYTALVLRTDSFLVVILNYAPVAVFLIVMNFIGIPAGTGSVWLIAGMLILFAASAVQALGVDTFSPLDRNGLYHVIAMVGVIVLHPGAAILSALFGG